ncbi:hypothetical protein BD309DRAFT_905736 [Dichomitus squalens]|nr:hypothetical protein BD309DRAFT_905736 [Dichomitus squalens]
MRFLDTRTGEFIERDPKATKYAILSHTWDKEGEQSYKELRKIQKRYDLKAQCPLHGYKSPPSSSTASPEVHPPSVPAPSSTVESAAPLHRARPAEGGNARKDNPMMGARRARVHRCLNTVGQFILLVLRPPCLQLLLPSGPPEHTPSPEESHMSTGIVERFRDPLLRPADGDRLKTPPCCIWDDPELSPKIRDACRVAREAGYNFLWIDSCCIDKTSSSESTESINSMYQWYGHATECYAFLADVPPGDDPRSPESKFRSSRWFRRGWTLQELISPSKVKFLSNDWNIIGTKHILVDLVEEITGIPDESLLHKKSLDEFSVAQRLSWAAKRKTTRVEDRAYSLLGIFNINMPTLYGEGHHAFRRLQEEIVQRVPDQSLFAWGHVYADLDAREDLAQCPSLQAAIDIRCRESNVFLARFLRDHSLSEKSLFSTQLEMWAYSGDIRAVSHSDVSRRLQLPHLRATRYTSTPHGIETQLPLIPLVHCLPQSEEPYFKIPERQWYLAILGCELTAHPGALLGRVCHIPPPESDVQYLHSGHLRITSGTGWQREKYVSLLPLPLETIERCREHDHIMLKTVYISRPERASTQSHSYRRHPHKTINLLLRRKTRDALRTQGYTAELRRPDEGHPTTHWLTLSCDDHTIAVEYRHTLEEHGRWLDVEADVKIRRHAPDRAGDIEADRSPVTWRDFTLGLSSPWILSLDMKEVAFTLATEKLIVKLGLDFAAPSHYFVRVDIVTETLPVESSASLQLVQGAQAEGSGAGDEVEEQDIGAQVRASEGDVLQPDDDAPHPMQHSDGTTGPLEARQGEERGADTKPDEEVDGER